MKNKNYLLAVLLIIVCISSWMAQPIPGSASITLFGEVQESGIEAFMDTYSDFDLKVTRYSYYRNWDGTSLTITYNPKLVPNEDDAAFLEFLRQDSRVMDAIQSANMTIPSPPAFLYDNIIEPGIPRVFTDPNYVPYSPPPDTLGYHIEQGEFIPNDPEFVNQWALKNTGQYVESSITGILYPGDAGADIKATLGWHYMDSIPNKNNREIVIAVFDGGQHGGFRLTNDEINWWVNPGEDTGLGNGIDDDGNGYIDDIQGWNFVDNNRYVQTGQQDDFHGTMVSGIIAANGNDAIGISGISGKDRNIKILPIRVQSTDNFEAAFKYVHAFRQEYNESGGQRGAHIVAINISMASPHPNIPNNNKFKILIDNLGSIGVLTIMTAPNAGIDIDIGDNHFFPPSLNSQYKIVVTNTTNKDEKYPISGWGAQNVALGAPGTDVRSTVFPPTPYINQIGTSLSAPQVSGAIALMYRATSENRLRQFRTNPGELALSMKNYLLESVDPLDDLQDITITGGRLNIFSAIKNMFESNHIVIDDDTTILDETINVDKNMIIHNNATLSIINSVVNFESYSIEIFSGGSLELINSVIHVESGLIFINDEGSSFKMMQGSHINFNDQIRGLIYDDYDNFENNGSITISNGANMEILNGSSLSFNNGGLIEVLSGASIYISDSGVTANNSVIHVINEGSTIVFEDDSELILNNTILEIKDKGSVIFYNSEFTKDGGQIILEGGSSIQFFEDSKFVTLNEVEILGHNRSLMYDKLITEYYTPIILTPSFRGGNTIGGDHILIHESSIDFSEQTIITNPEGYRWEGIYFVNCEDGGILRGNISGIVLISLDNSNLVMQDIDINNVRSIGIYYDSFANINNMNYSNNLQGIYVLESNINITDSTILDNGQFGIIFRASSAVNHFNRVTIAGNDGNGLRTFSSSVYLKNTIIENNTGVGFADSGHSTLANNTIIRNNHRAELEGIGQRWLTFTRDNILENFPTISDSLPYPNYKNRYLLMAMGEFEGQLNCVNLNIDRSDPTRFHPSYHSFDFTGQSISIEAEMYLVSINLISGGNYEDGRDNLLDLIETYPNSIYANMSISKLPYLVRSIDDDYDTLLNYLAKIDEDDLYISVQEAMAVTHLFAADYANSVNQYGNLIAIDALDEHHRLIAAGNQAYAYLRASETGERNMPMDSVYKPTTYLEYYEILNEIYAILYNFEDDEEENETIPPIYEISLQNFPNPFNPETTILYTVPRAGAVILEIFNIRGQKVKTIVNETLEAGHHEIVWNGMNDNGQKVASGVYLYRLKAGGENITRRMVLLK